MNKKEITINGTQYNFVFNESLNMWRIIEGSNILSDNTIDLEINLEIIGNMDWAKIIKFITLLQSNNSLLLQRIESAKSVLSCLFKAINKNVYTEKFFNEIEFRLTGIDFRGSCKIPNMENYFEYDCFFFPIFKADPYKDLGAFVWRANFRDTLLLGVYCDRI